MSDIGPKVAESIYGWFHEKRNLHFLEKLHNVGVIITRPDGTTKKTNTKIASKLFVLTGTLLKLSRDKAKEEIRERGGIVSESVSGKTDFLVAGENPGSKYEKAKKLGIAVLNETEFLELLS